MGLLYKIVTRGVVFCLIVLGVALVTAVLLNARAYAIDEKPVSSPLPPMPYPNLKPGAQWHGLRKGQSIFAMLLSVQGTSQTWKDSDRCVWTSPAPFAPSTMWRNCPLSYDGTQTITKIVGRIFPLKVGSSVTYHYSGTNTENWRWEGVRTCSVKSTVRITTSLGSFDTFKVVCTDPWNVRTRYISPKLNAVVYSHRLKKRVKVEIDFVLKKVVNWPGQ